MAAEKTSNSLVYPKKRSIQRFIYKLPLVLWRLGLGSYLSHPARGGRKMLVITTLGRKSGLPRHTMASYISHNKRDYVISGWWLRSDWVKNFHQDPLVTIQAGGRIYAAHPRRVEDLEEFTGVVRALFDSGGDSHFGDWLDSLGIDRDLDQLLENRDRVHLVGFDPVADEGPAPLSADLAWIWALIISILLFILFYIW